MMLSLTADEKETQSLVDSTKTKLQLINNQIAAYAALGGGFGNLYSDRDDDQQALTDYQNKLSVIQGQIAAINKLSADDYLKNTSTSASSATNNTNEALQEQLKLIEHRKALNDLSYQDEIDWLQTILSTYAQTADERMQIEEKIYTAKQNLQKQEEQAASDAYNNELGRIEHLANMDELSKTQQLAWLQAIYSQYTLTADERMALEEKIHAAQKEVQEEQAAAVKQQRQDELALLDHKKNMDELSAADEISWLQRILSQYETDTSDKYSLEERIYKLKKQQAEDLQKQQEELEEKQKKLIEDRLNSIKQAREFTAITYEEELQQLYKLRREVSRFSEQWKTISSEIKSVLSSMTSDRSSQWEDIGNGVVEALKNKYQEQKDIEEKRLNDSIESWKNWEDETTKAIQSQIDALDDLADAQESEDKRQEYENKRQATALQLAYEKDDYNRAELQKELNRLDKAEADRLAEEDRKNQKEQLQKQIDDAKELSSQKQTAIQTEIDTLGTNYEKLMTNMSLQAEAYKYMVTHSQSDIIDLIGSYAPEYENIGKTFGERLYAGMRSALGNIDWWMRNAATLMQYYQTRTADTANTAADKFWATRTKYETTINNLSAPATETSPTINMTVNFNAKVEHPSDVTKRMESVTQYIISEIKK
jgi:hypothetical protein